jgi:Flp pilus assembly protein TadD
MRKYFLPAVLLLCCSAACLPSSARSLNRAADLYQAGQFREAAEEYRKAINIDPEWSAPYLGLGNALLELGDRVGAESAYRRAAALAPGSPEAQIALAQVLIDAQRWADAEHELNDALKKLPEEGRLHAMHGVALAKQTRDREALEAFERSQQLCPQCMTRDQIAIYTMLSKATKPSR